MPASNSTERYSAVIQALHWTTVILVLLAWGIGIGGDALPRAVQGPAWFIHMNAGVAVIVLTALRLGWRSSSPSPAPLGHAGPMGSLLGLGAKLTHAALYILLLAVPVLGIMVQFARGRGVPVLGLFEIASPWVPDRAFARTVFGVHELAAHTLLALAGLHAATALVRHFILRDRTLARMLPGR